MTRVIFYTNVGEPLDFLRRFLAGKVCRAKKTALIYCEASALTRLDDDLWEFGFIPHAVLASPAGAHTPVVLSADAPPDDYHADFLILWHTALPDFVGRFGVYVDIVGTAAQAREQGRKRYGFFKTHGYPIEHIPMAAV